MLLFRVVIFFQLFLRFSHTIDVVLLAPTILGGSQDSDEGRHQYDAGVSCGRIFGEPTLMQTLVSS